MAQWLRIHLARQGTQGRSLVWEDSTCWGATKSVCYRAYPPQKEKPLLWDTCAPQLESSPHSLQLEKSCSQQWRSISQIITTTNFYWRVGAIVAQPQGQWKSWKTVIEMLTVCVCAVLSWLFATPWTIDHQALLSLGFPVKNTEMGCHFFLHRIFLKQGSNPCFLHLLYWQVDSLLLRHQGNPGWHTRQGILPVLSKIFWSDILVWTANRQDRQPSLLLWAEGGYNL